MSQRASAIPAASEDYLTFMRGMTKAEVESAQGLVDASVNQPRRVQLEAARDLRHAKAKAGEWS